MEKEGHMFNLTQTSIATKKWIVLLILLMGVSIPTYADYSFGVDVVSNIENNITLEAQEAVDSLKSELMLSIQLQMAEMLFEHQLSTIINVDDNVGIKGRMSQDQEEE